MTNIFVAFARNISLVFLVLLKGIIQGSIQHSPKEPQRL